MIWHAIDMALLAFAHRCRWKLVSPFRYACHASPAGYRACSWRWDSPFLTNNRDLLPLCLHKSFARSSHGQVNVHLRVTLSFTRLQVLNVWFRRTAARGIFNVPLYCALDWDLGVCLQYECKRKQLHKPDVFNNWIDLRSTYRVRAGWCTSFTF